MHHEAIIFLGTLKETAFEIKFMQASKESIQTKELEPCREIYRRVLFGFVLFNFFKVLKYLIGKYCCCQETPSTLHPEMPEVRLFQLKIVGSCSAPGDVDAIIGSVSLASAFITQAEDYSCCCSIIEALWQL